ncbi:sce7725 family protein [Mucilaginibacter sp. Mucisp84]|uniref:sce7725 family protein n=1 Tax=Mucilaginibacter sp. Mucisp84 TaxID=3243058 RepID=UPI0039A753F9
MYFPYLRGKQFELLALRELAALPLESAKISPVIEPLKTDTRSILTMVKTISRDIKLHLIINPQYGEIKSGSKVIAELVKALHNFGYQNIIPAFIISTNRDLGLLKTFLTQFGFDSSGYSLLHLNQIAGIEELKTIVSSTNCKYNIIQVEHIFALRRNFPKQTLVYLSDPFNRQTKNADYVHINDENFSTDHLYYEDEGFVGFGDYLTIGSAFIDGGRLPWAVVIHLTYLDEESNIRIKHFVSDSNDDDADTAGKFAEALSKLIDFIDDRKISTIATNAFRDLYERGAYPGLGTIKKLSVMHHIELVHSLI